MKDLATQDWVLRKRYLQDVRWNDLRVKPTRQQLLAILGDIEASGREIEFDGDEASDTTWIKNIEVSDDDKTVTITLQEITLDDIPDGQTRKLPRITVEEISQTAYDALATKDPNVLYCITS